MAAYGGKRRPFIFKVVKILCWIILPFFFRIRTVGMENLPESTTFILLPKHQRWEDIPLLGMVIPRVLYYIAKQELFMNPISAFFISSLGGIPLNRKRPLESRNGIIKIFDNLQEGDGVVIFPEGTYYPGCMGPGKTGLLKMIQSSLIQPLIPVGIMYSKDGIRTNVQISLGRPIYGDSTEIIEHFPDIVMDEIARLSGLGNP